MQWGGEREHLKLPGMCKLAPKASAGTSPAAAPAAAEVDEPPPPAAPVEAPVAIADIAVADPAPMLDPESTGPDSCSRTGGRNTLTSTKTRSRESSINVGSPF